MAGAGTGAGVAAAAARAACQAVVAQGDADRPAAGGADAGVAVPAPGGVGTRGGGPTPDPVRTANRASAAARSSSGSARPGATVPRAPAGHIGPAAGVGGFFRQCRRDRPHGSPHRFSQAEPAHTVQGSRAAPVVERPAAGTGKWGWACAALAPVPAAAAAGGERNGPIHTAEPWGAEPGNPVQVGPPTPREKTAVPEGEAPTHENPGTDAPTDVAERTARTPAAARVPPWTETVGGL